MYTYVCFIIRDNVRMKVSAYWIIHKQNTSLRRSCDTLIIIMVISKCYFSGELIALSYKTKQQQRCEHRIRKNKQIKSNVHDENKKIMI